MLIFRIHPKANKLMSKLIVAILILSFVATSALCQNEPIKLEYRETQTYEGNESDYGKSLRGKDSLLFHRTDFIYKKKKAIIKLFYKLEDKQGGLTEKQIDFNNYFIKEVNKILTSDLTDDRNYLKAKQWICNQEDRVYKWL